MGTQDTCSRCNGVGYTEDTPVANNEPAAELPVTSEPAWIKLYHHKGIDVRLPIRVGGPPISVDDFRNVLASVDNALAAGWFTEAPGLEEGEHKEMIGWVAHRVKENDDGTTTPIVDLYPDHEQMAFSILTIYLNHDADVAAFERASGMKLATIATYVGAGKLERGKSKQTDALIKRSPKAFAVAWKPNPRYDPNEQDTTKKKPKRLFSRWPDLAPNVEATNPTASVFERSKEKIAGWKELAQFREGMPKILAAHFPLNEERELYNYARERVGWILLDSALNGSIPAPTIEAAMKDPAFDLLDNQKRDIRNQLALAAKANPVV